MSYKTEPLSQVATVIDSLHKTPKYDDNGTHYMARATDVKYGYLNLSNMLKVNTDVYNDFTKRYKPSNGDIIITRVGSYGNTSFVKNTNFCLGQNTAAIVPNINNKYLFYMLNSRNIRHQIESYVVGTTQKTLSLKAINSILVPRFNEETEQKIAHILSTLDDKIELNRKMNQTLEEMAQALFKSWFIEEVGDEWEECKLSDVLEIKYGKDHKKLAEGNIPVYGSGGVMRYADNFLYDKESILIPRKGTLTNLFYIDEPFWTVDTIFWSKINTEKVSGKFLFSFLKTIDLSNLNVGSAVPSLTTKVLNEIKISIPTIDEQKEFNEYADSAWKKMKSNRKQIKTLEEMRDTLLPKLLSGELDVSEVEI